MNADILISDDGFAATVYPVISGYGMSIGHKDSDNVVRKNTILGNKQGGVYWRAVTKPMAAHRVTFEHNTVQDNEGWGCLLTATQGTLIRHNVIEDTGVGRQVTGVRFGKQAGEVVLKDNTIKASRPTLDEREEPLLKNSNDDPSTEK